MAHGGAMGEVYWVVVLRGQRVLLAELGAGDGVVLFRFGACDRARERQGRVRVSARGHYL